MVNSSTGASTIMRDNAALDDVRGQALRYILIVLFILGWTMTFITVRSDSLSSWLPALALLLSAPISYALVGRHYRLSAWMMIAGVEIALFLLARLYPEIAAPYALPMAVFLVGEFLEAPATLLVTGYSCVILLVVLPGSAGYGSFNVLIPPALLSIGAGLFSWLSTRPLYVELDRAWNS